MQLAKLLDGIENLVWQKRFGDTEIAGISSDSRSIKPGQIYIAVKGSKFDGHQFIPEVIKKGVTEFIVEEKPDINDDKICWIVVPKAQDLVKPLARRYYGNPSEEVITIGITGTNGKTTSSYLIESILSAAEHSCGVIGTVNYRIGERVLPSINTTPGLVENQQLLSQLADEGVDYCAMEVSSHALDQGRVDLIDFRAAIFTNLTGDHLDYHKTMENYFTAKAKLFINLKPEASAVINIDDAYGRKLVSKTPAKVWSFGIHNRAEVMATDIKMNISGTRFRLKAKEDEVLITTKLVGEYNIYNILGAAAACFSLGISLEKIKKGIERVGYVPGRLERVDCGQAFSVFIDYAHTHDALENVLNMLRKTTRGKIITVFGCGGDRDVTKRPKMGKVASALSDLSIVTSDNPRTEDPEEIIEQILQGFDNDHYLRIVNRKEGIEKALSLAKADDVVLIAGKGHEHYQIFKDTTINFDEKAIVRDFILRSSESQSVKQH